jgi:hypothetical protein
MDGELKFIKHQGKEILLVDFSDGRKEQILLLLNQIQATIAQHSRNSVLTLADFTGAQVDKAVATRIKEVLTLDRPFVKRSAWVGTKSLPKVFYENFKTFSQRDFPTFETREEAMDWLVKD